MTTHQTSDNPFPVKDRTGHRCGRWTILGPSQSPKPNGKFYWTCVCVCGTRKDVTENSIAKSVSVGCGCTTPFDRDSMIGRPSVHGLCGTWVYSVWQGMIKRCYSENDIEYETYGGRGIKVCESWKNSVEEFYKDMGERPSKKHSLDRIDSDGDYGPSNCRWATSKEQSRNKRSNRFVELAGERKTISEWAETTGLNKTLIRERLNRGHSPEVALSHTDLRSSENVSRRERVGGPESVNGIVIEAGEVVADRQGGKTRGFESTKQQAAELF